MDIPQETPNWKLNISQKLAERDKGNIDFSNLISQLNTTKDKLKETESEQKLAKK